MINNNFTLYVLINKSLIEIFENNIKKFNIDTSAVKVIELFDCEKVNRYSDYTLKFNLEPFRDSFWISTTARFFYIEEFMKKYNVDSVFHIENDVMLYVDLHKIRDTLKSNEMYMVQDSATRVVPSIVYIPNVFIIEKLNNFILEKVKNSEVFLNDMGLLGEFHDKKHFPIEFGSNYLFDGAAIGQYLGGVDPRNLPNATELDIINNPSKGFINETSSFKITKDITFFRKNMIINKDRGVSLFYGKHISDIVPICNLHIHSKQLYQFSSVFDIKYTDIITGDCILTLCDFIISTPEIFAYHQNLNQYINVENVIIVNDFNNVNIKALNEYITSLNKKCISLFIYTHIWDLFVRHILDYLPKNLKFTIYLHNSDHGLNDVNKLLDNKSIHKVYSQNVNCIKSDKIVNLPIGLANSMFKHGDILTLYKTMSKTYKLMKTKNIYININPNTYPYRRDFVNCLNNYGIKTDKASKPFQEYLNELADHHFSLSLRGNGLDTHRFYESLYLNTIPVIINNKYTDMSNFVQYLRELDLPFYEIKEDCLDTIVNKYFLTNFFNKSLYLQMTKHLIKPIGCLDALKLSYYSQKNE